MRNPEDTLYLQKNLRAAVVKARGNHQGFRTELKNSRQRLFVYCISTDLLLQHEVSRCLISARIPYGYRAGDEEAVFVIDNSDLKV